MPGTSKSGKRNLGGVSQCDHECPTSPSPRTGFNKERKPVDWEMDMWTVHSRLTALMLLSLPPVHSFINLRKGDE